MKKEFVVFTYVQFMFHEVRECMCFKSWPLANDFMTVMEREYGDAFKVLAIFDRQV